MTTLAELCAGTASVSLWAMAGIDPLTGYMGSKRADRSRLVRMLLGNARPDRVVLVDAGPWGDVWVTLRNADQRRAVAEVLREWDAAGDLVEVWPWLVQCAPPTDPARRVAQYIALQSRAAGCIPVWWSAEAGRWESPSGGRTHGDCAEAASPARVQVEAAHQRGVFAAERRCKQPTARKVGPVYRSRPSRGLVCISTLAKRVEALDAIDWARVDVIHGDVRDVEPSEFGRGVRVLFDPPYHGCPRYAELLPRSDVMDLAAKWSEYAEFIAVCEAEPLPLPGWQHERLRARGKPEWLTTWGTPAAVMLPVRPAPVQETMPW